MRRFSKVLLALLVLLGSAYYWLLVDNRPGGVSVKPIQIAQLRALAASRPGQSPTAVEMELVGSGRPPGDLFVAGSGLERKQIGIMAFRLPVPRSGPVVIDSGIAPGDAGHLRLERFDSAAQQRVNLALRAASTIILTHEHFDHEGGLVALGDPAVLARVRFNAAQLPGNPLPDMMQWPPGPPPIATVTGEQPVAIAPGVVVIPAPSHTPGSQMVFVRLADGREFLFCGDIATMAQSWRELRARSRLLSQVIGEEDRSEVYTWLHTIRALKAAAPGLEVIAGHDYEWIKRSPGLRGMTEHFSN